MEQGYERQIREINEVNEIKVKQLQNKIADFDTKVLEVDNFLAQKADMEKLLADLQKNLEVEKATRLE